MASMPKFVSHFAILSSFLCICGLCQLKHAYCCSNQVSTYFQQSKNLEPSCNQFFGNAHCIEKIPALWAGTSPLRRCAPAHQAGISPVNRLTCSPSWYQPDVVSQTCQNNFFGFFSTQNPKLLPEKLKYPHFSLQIWILRQNSPLVTSHRISINTLTDQELRINQHTQSPTASYKYQITQLTNTQIQHQKHILQTK
jgi:putative component of membrane protein insertase Oxa1/YidC/SpoIIIJ protein YidD